MTEQAEPRWLELLRSQLGTEEVAGEGNNPVVTGYFRRVTGQALPDSTPWCAAVLGWAMLEAGYAAPAELPFWARSWLDWGVPLDQSRRAQYSPEGARHRLKGPSDGPNLVDGKGPLRSKPPKGWH